MGIFVYGAGVEEMVGRRAESAVLFAGIVWARRYLGRMRLSGNGGSGEVEADAEEEDCEKW